MFNIQDLAIGLGGILALCVTILTLAKQWSGRSKIKNITNSDWNFVTDSIKELREDSDKHEVLIAEIKTADKFIKESIIELKGFVIELREKGNIPCPYHPLKKASDREHEPE